MISLNNIIITNIKDVFTVTSPRGRNEKILNRPNYGLSFCLSGQITYTHRGNKIISDRNHAILHPEGQTYTLHGDKTGIFPVINFTCAKPFNDTITSIQIRETEPYIKDFEQMKNLFLFDRNRAKVISILYNILHRIHLEQTQSCEIIEPAIKYLEKNYYNPNLTNSELSAKCNISEVYFRRLFTEQYGITPKQYIVDIRIQKAKQLLSDGILKISAVSEKCGFSNQYHFCRMFKEKTGMTPSEYIKQNKIYGI